MKKITILLLLLQISQFIIGQNDTNNTITLNHLALSVKDVDRSANFYKDIIQLQEITNRTKTDGIRWFSFNEGKELHLVSVLSESVKINKAVHFAITTSNFDAFVERLDALKIVYSDWPGTLHKITIRADGIKQIYFQDPDGYWIELNSVGEQ